MEKKEYRKMNGKRGGRKWEIEKNINTEKVLSSIKLVS